MRIKPKKSLGQNFLVDRNIQQKIAQACTLSPDDIILEIGSGRGELTEILARSVKRLYTLELDQRMLPILEDKLQSFGNCRIIHGDILKFDIGKFKHDEQVKQRLKVIGNIPYYISSPIIQHLITYRQHIAVIYLTVQKEFGLRIAASSGSKDYGSFSCFAQYYLKPEIIFTIKKGSFFPAPKVDSCFLKLTVRENPAVKVSDEEKFFALIRKAFGQRRKMLKNNLKQVVSSKLLDKFFTSRALDSRLRPEELTLEQFADLSNFFKKKS